MPLYFIDRVVAGSSPYPVVKSPPHLKQTQTIESIDWIHNVKARTSLPSLQE